MAVIETWFNQDLQKPVKVQYIDGSMFSNNGNGNRIGVNVYDNGEAVTLTGSVSGYAVLSDGTTVPCTGARTGNKASILVPPAAYVPGALFLSVFLTDGETVTTLAAVSTSVLLARTDSQVDPGTVVTDWTQTINGAMQDVQTAAENLGQIVATPYASLTYPVPLGRYTYYNGNLYRCVSPIAASENFTPAHWSSAINLGDEVSNLKSAFDDYIVADSEGKTVDWSDYYESSYNYGWCNGTFENSGAANNSRYYLRFRTSLYGMKFLKITAPANYAVAVYVFKRSDSSFIKKIGQNDIRQSNATNSLTVICEDQYKYIFSVGRFANNDSPDYMNDQTFINQIVLKLYDDYAYKDAVIKQVTDEKNLYTYNVYDIVSQCQKINNTSHGITFSWDNDGNCSYSGTSDGESAINTFYYDESHLPEGVSAGDYLVGKSNAGAAGFRIYSYDSEGTRTNVGILYANRTVRIPEDAVGLRLHIELPGPPAGTSYSGTISPKLITSDKAQELTRIIKENVFNLYELTGSKNIEAGSDLFDIADPGLYHCTDPSAVKNAPTKYGFKLIVFVRNNNATRYAFLMDSQGKFFTSARNASGEWKEWIKYGTDDGDNLPDYYADYMEERIADVNKLENEISDKSDSFLFITDYHVKRNTENSLHMIKKIVLRTGITKLFFGGDAYATVTATDGRTDEQAMAYARKFVPMVYSSMQESIPEFFSVFGNHEWNHLQANYNENLKNGYELNFSGAYNYCLKRHESHVSEMDENGNYYVDNRAKKIRYFFLQEDGEARPSNATLNWLGNQLLSVPTGYYVFVIAHFAYIPGSLGETEPSLNSYSGRMLYLPKLISDILQAYNTKGTFSMDFSFTANSVTRTYNGSWDYANAPGNNVIGIISGHIHHDDVLEKSANNVLVIATTGDLHMNGSGENYTFIDGEGETVEREEGTIYEQAFDAVHIDLENRKVHLTRFGAGLDREFTF